MMKKVVLIPVFLTLLFWGVPSAFALLVGISATWSGTEATKYGLTSDSIVQVVAIQSGQSYPSGSGPAAHFEQYGTTTDDSNPPHTHNVYLGNTTAQAGNDIVYTGTLTPDGNGGYKLQTYVYLDNVNSYDQIYIRVFGQEFKQGEAEPIGWGVSTAQQINAEPGILPVLSWQNVATTATNYFEVIPEPGTLGLLWSGLFGIGTAGFWRRARRKRSADADGTGDIVP